MFNATSYWVDGVMSSRQMRKQSQTSPVARQKYARGFTLLELIITIGIFAIIAGFAIPGFQNLIEANRVTTQTNNLLSALKTARSEAVRRVVRSRWRRWTVISTKDGASMRGWEPTATAPTHFVFLRSEVVSVSIQMAPTRLSSMIKGAWRRRITLSISQWIPRTAMATRASAG